MKHVHWRWVMAIQPHLPLLVAVLDKLLHPFGICIGG